MRQHCLGKQARLTNGIRRMAARRCDVLIGATSKVEPLSVSVPGVLRDGFEIEKKLRPLDRYDDVASSIYIGGRGSLNSFLSISINQSHLSLSVII